MSKKGKNEPIVITVSGGDERTRELVTKLIVDDMGRHDVTVTHSNPLETEEDLEFNIERKLAMSVTPNTVRIRTYPPPAPAKMRRKRSGAHR